MKPAIIPWDYPTYELTFVKDGQIYPDGIEGSVLSLVVSYTLETTNGIMPLYTVLGQAQYDNR